MLSLLELYQWAILAAVLFAGALTMTGCHLAGRDRSMQTMCVGQGAMLGVLLGLGLTQVFFHEHDDAALVGPFVSAILVAIGVYFLSERLAARRVAGKNTYFSAIFATLLAAGYLVSALFPALENHMAQRFFGDIATLSGEEAYVTIGLAAAVLLVHVFLWKRFSADSFNLSILGESSLSAKGNWSPLVFDLVALVTICFAVQIVGFLFTVTCLFLPTTVISFTKGRGLSRHLVMCLGVCAVAVAAGFAMSLYRSNLPTVPTIVMAIVVFGGVSLVFERLLTRGNFGDARLSPN